MSGRTSQLDQAAAITKAVQAVPLASEFRDHVAEILGSSAFKGSRRSQEFLAYIVDQALAGHFDSLKERALGVQLFGRKPSYDTGEDAIVRVTASDVRRRLHLYYSQSSSRWKIDLPVGSYIPDFHKTAPADGITSESATPAVAEASTNRFVFRQWPYAIVFLCVLAAGAWLWQTARAPGSARPDRFHPWSVLLNSGRDLRIVLCDPDVSLLQQLFGFNISLSEYANKQFVPASRLQPPLAREIAARLRGVNVASVDAAIALDIARLAQSAGRHVRTQNARALQMSEFKTEDDFVMLGSPRSNPWSALFEKPLHFRFEFDSATNQEVVVNTHVQPGESSRYVPTAKGWDTGEAYGIIGFTSNPGQTGHVLLIAGTNAEATEAAGKLAVNFEALGQTLHSRGIDASRTAQSFQVLLRVGTIAGSSNSSEVIAVHRLSE